MILTQNDQGYWTETGNPDVRLKHTHAPENCRGRLCDVHDRRGPEPMASWPLNWRSDRQLMEVICPHGIGHPTPAQLTYWLTLVDSGRVTYSWASAQALHGCDGCCYHREEIK